MDEFGLLELRPSRKRLRRGDIFVMRLALTDEYVFGRVIDADAVFPLGGDRGATLIYVYDERSADSEPPESFSPKDLLIPPQLTNTLGWSRGYFETVQFRELGDADVLPQHCFRTLSGKLLDEHGRVVRRACSEPTGSWAVAGYGSIYYEVTNALNIPVVGE